MHTLSDAQSPLSLSSQFGDIARIAACVLQQLIAERPVFMMQTNSKMEPTMETMTRREYLAVSLPVSHELLPGDALAILGRDLMDSTDFPSCAPLTTPDL